MSPVDGWIISLLILPFGAGLFLFGGVRLWSFGPLTLVVFLAGLLFWFRSRAALSALRIPPGGVFLALFLLYAGVQSAIASAVPWSARVQFLLITGSAISLFLWTQLSGRRNRWKILFAVALILITLVAWYALIQNSQGSRMVLNLERPTGYGMRASGTHICPNHFANLMAMGLCLSLTLLMAPEVGWPLKLIAGYSFLLLGYPLVLTQSRTGMLGAGAGLGTLLLLAALRRSRRVFLITMIAVPLLLSAAGWGVWHYGPGMQERVAQAVQSFETGDDIRLDTWRGTIHMLRQHPVFGWGGGSYRWVEPRFQTYVWSSTMLYAHNEYLQLQSEYGAVGTGLLSVFIVLILVRLTGRVLHSPRPRNSLLAAGCIAVLVCSGVHALLDFNFHIFSNAHFLLLVLGAIFSCLFEDGEWTPIRLPQRGFSLIRATGIAVSLLLFAGLLQSVLSYGLVFPATAAREKNNFERSDRLFRLAMRIDPGAWEPRLGLARLIKTRAYLLANPQSRPDWLNESLECYEQALVRNPYEMEVLFGLSHLYALRGDAEKSLYFLREMVRLQPQFPYYRSRMGVQLFRMGRMEEARIALEEVRKQDFSDEAARVHLPEILRRLSLEEKARGIPPPDLP